MQVEEAKAAVESGLLTTSTLTSLRDLLRVEADRDSEGLKTTTNVGRNGAAAKTTTARNAKPGAARLKRAVPVTIREDASKSISGREKYGLATHMVNHSLKLLASPLKSQPKHQDEKFHPPSEDAHTTSDSTPPQVLQPRSLNISPGGPSPKKSRINGAGSVQPPEIATSAAPNNALAVAQCAQLGFSFLLNADFQALGVREMQRWQLETGLLALVGNLISHGLDELAVKQLRIVKQRFEAALGSARPVKAIKLDRGRPIPPEQESLAALLCLKASFVGDPAALAIANTYQQHALRLISRAPTVTVMNELPTYLAIDAVNGPVDLIVQQAKATKDFAKAAKQLQGLANTILCLGPSVALTEDEIASNPQKSPDPETMLRLQTTGLQIRKLWWKLAKHQADIARELLEPFFRCAMAFVRRQDMDIVHTGASRLLETCFELIGPLDSTAHGHHLFPIHNVLCFQAKTEGRIQEAQNWAERMSQDCATLDRNHARVIVALLRKATLLGRDSGSEWEASLAAAVDSLQSKITGTNADYDLLIDSVESLSRNIYDCRKQADETSRLIKVLTLGATFSQRYARSYPGRSTQKIVSILDVSLRNSHTTEDLLAWVTPDSARVLMQAGALNLAAETAATRPLLEVWQKSREVRSLSRVLNVLLLKAMRSNADSAAALVFDDENLDAAERGILLEWQLQCGADLAHRIKYHEPLKKFLPEVLRRLAKLYDASELPLRRTRVATSVFAIREAHPNLILPHQFKVWQDSPIVDCTNLGQDHVLVGYHDDLMTRLAILRLFSNGRPTTEDLRPYLSTWQQLFSKCDSIQSLYDHYDDPTILRQQLRSIATYHRMQGDDGAALPVYHLLMQIDQLIHPHSPEARASRTYLAETYLSLGYCRKAAGLLNQSEAAQHQSAPADLTLMEHKILYAEYLFQVERLDHCASTISECTSLHAEVIRREHTRAYETLHARIWLLQSKLSSATGRLQESLLAAKRAVQKLNSIWSSIERLSGTRKIEISTEPTFENDKAVNGLAQGISKLQLTPTEDKKADTDDALSKRGAAFWPMMPIVTKALLHLSDVYTHHGLFNEADYYSQRAISVTDSVGSTLLLSQVRSHRSRLLTLAGQTQDAELCIAQDGDVDLGSASSAHVDRYCAKAMLKVKEGSLSDALELCEKGEHVLNEMMTEKFLANLERFYDAEGRFERQTTASTLTLTSAPKKERAIQTTSKPVKRPATKLNARCKREVEPSNIADCEASGVTDSNDNFIHRRMKSSMAVEKALIVLHLGKQCDGILASLNRAPDGTLQTFRERLMQHHSLVHKATTMLQGNVTLSLLAESTLSLPGLKALNRESSEPKKKVPSKSGPRSIVKTSAKSTKVSSQLGEGPESLLFAAMGCFGNQIANFNKFSTSEIHLSQSGMSNASFLASAIANYQADELVVPVDEAMHIEFPSMAALQLEKGSVLVDMESSDDTRQPTRPHGHPSFGLTNMSGSGFQTNFIDILPKTWTAVSLCLSEDGNDLYIARYRSGVAPYTLKLPFSRHKPDDDDAIDELGFDYHKGKAELQDIIGRSNYSCHNPGKMDQKGAKTRWWKEREDLDRRLHALLLNIENIWFGGFKSIFSQHRSLDDALLRLRASLDQILARHLPSRRTGKGGASNLKLDNRVLELFIGLETVRGTTSDLEEPVTDLLYFVVDMLQFKGERNAYDEIDFDSMTIDVLDALQTYHNLAADDSIMSQHLILVLDRRLQAFPWESLPCLEGSSVSRVGSMLSLRDCIVSMRMHKQTSNGAGAPDSGAEYHTVCRSSGTYVLNPSSDLAPTQAMLEPSLSTLLRTPDSHWSSIVNRVPSEDEFISALTTSSVMLYFGHGAGSQYIRPRTIKRLEQCSEVVWLMGCSSGSVWEYGDLEPCAVPLAYLLAGNKDAGDRSRTDEKKCMSVVATLWDVTDKDIDRFTLAVGEDWGLWPATSQSKLPAKTPRKREIVAQPSTPVQIPKTPKTPAARKTPAIVKTPAIGKSRPRDNEDRKLSLVEAVARSRDACVLRYLNGAAPVVYGVPIYLDD